MDENQDYSATDKCGRCGCTRQDHVPACKDHPKCKGFSTPKDRRPKPKKRR